METYIAYFDILGFKEFIENNEKNYIDKNFENIFRESQTALSGEKNIKHNSEMIPDLDMSEVNCLHFSDSIVFWSKDKSEESFLKIIDVSYIFYKRCMQLSFPVRGCVVKGDIEFISNRIPNQNNVAFYNSSIYGKGFVEAYLKAENQDWAGCYIDKSAIESVSEKVIYNLLYCNKIVYYAVPLKDGLNTYEHAIRIIGSDLNNVYFRNLAREVERIFSLHMNGKPLSYSVKRKMNNTIKFLEFFRTNEIITKVRQKSKRKSETKKKTKKKN